MSQPGRDALDGVRVAILEARMASEVATLVARYGGLVTSAPALREAPIDAAGAVSDFLNRLSGTEPRVFVFLTGVGATTLLTEAERQGRLQPLLDTLKHATVACRGPKPVAALKRYGITPTISAASPYTSKELLDALAGVELADTNVTVVHYGERSEFLADALRERGAVLDELCVYEWRLPDDITPLERLVHSITRREVDAVIFTSQVQWKHLLEVAANIGLADSVIDALDSDVVVAAIGPVCSAALAASDVRPRVVPANPKMGPLVAELARYFAGKTNKRVGDEEK